MIEVADVVEHENGDATYVFEMSRAEADTFNEIGIRLVLFCHVAGVTTEDVFKDLRRKIDNQQVEVEETIAGRYEMSMPGEKDYEV